MPKVTIIMSSYNNAVYLPDALESALGQSFNDWELLVVNDNSSDGTKDILETYKNKDSRIIIWTNQTNQGLTKNLNTALDKAQGEYIARLDSDDIWSDKQKLEKQVDFLNKNPNCCLVGTWAQAFGGKGKKLFTISQAPIRKSAANYCFIIVLSIAVFWPAKLIFWPPADMI